jgi:hypothetical protein
MFSVLEAVEESVEAVVAMEPLWLSIIVKKGAGCGLLLHTSKSTE